MKAFLPRAEEGDEKVNLQAQAKNPRLKPHSFCARYSDG
jgi:hypothetical protein